MDDADHASDLQDAEIESALMAHARAIAQGPKHTHCIDCGMEIQPARLAAVPGASRCVMCQVDHDRRSAWGV